MEKPSITTILLIPIIGAISEIICLTSQKTISPIYKLFIEKPASSGLYPAVDCSETKLSEIEEKNSTIIVLNANVFFIFILLKNILI